MHDKPLTLIVRTAGTNCECELRTAFELAGSRTEMIHLDALIADPSRIERADILAFPGGFSYGDDIAAGRVFSMKLRTKLWGTLRNAAERGVPMIGVCNGFQMLVQAGLLPGFEPGIYPDSAPEPSVALTQNAEARFIDEWTRVEYPADSKCIWTRGLAGCTGDAALLPIANGEGRFVAASDSTIAQLESGGQIAVRYVDNPGGSQGSVAGICDPSGRIFGLMPHPERFIRWTHHPYWTRLSDKQKAERVPGLVLFQGVVESVASQPV
jgi:phosphoribosylformylglycinamidine synthase